MKERDVQRAELDLVETDELILALSRRSEVFTFAFRAKACRVAGAKPVLLATFKDPHISLTEAIGYVRTCYIRSEMALLSGLVTVAAPPGFM